jgi:hypothetical protein
MTDRDRPTLGERAEQHIRYFAETIGPRPTGSEAEAQALSYAESCFQDLGLNTARDPVTEIRPHRRIRWIGVMMVTVITLSLIFINVLPWLPLAILVSFFGVIMPVLRRQMQKPYAGGLSSFNLIAEQAPTGEPQQTLILGAHIDTASAGIYYATGWRHNISAWVGFSGMARSLLLLIGIEIIRIFTWGTGDDIAWVLFQMVRVYLVLNWLYIMSLFVERYQHPDRFAPGANDNASGVGTVMALAEHFSQHPPQNTHLRFMVFCAEEVGLIGSTRYAEKIEDQDHLYALTFDMVGTGNLVQFVRRTTNPLKSTDEQLNTWLTEAGAKAGPFLALGASDYDGFARRGIPATGVYTTGEKVIFKVYHSTGDTMEHIDAACLEKTIQTAIEVVGKLDNSRSSTI